MFDNIKIKFQFQLNEILEHIHYVSPMVCQILNPIKMQNCINLEWYAHTCHNCSGLDLYRKLLLQ